jgi:hypothetical protein
MTIGDYAVDRSHEPILGKSGRGVAKDFCLVSRINAIRLQGTSPSNHWRRPIRCRRSVAAVVGVIPPAAEVAIEAPNTVMPTSTVKAIFFPILKVSCIEKT